VSPNTAPFSEIRELPVDAIAPNPLQPRRVFAESEIVKLASSIAEIGLMQPILVRTVQTLDGANWQLIAGERRLRAHRLLGKAIIKAVVVEASDENAATMALAENMDREDLTAYEIAVSIQNLLRIFKNKTRLAHSLGLQRSDLYRYLAFFKLPDFILNDLDAKPALLGRDAADDIAGAVGKHGEAALPVLSRLWTTVKSGEIDQGKVGACINAAMNRSEHGKRERDEKPLFIGKEQAGRITRDDKKLTVEIKTAALPPKKERELRSFIEKLLVS